MYSIYRIASVMKAYCRPKSRKQITTQAVESAALLPYGY